jgi:outer membrane biosynthesis protein TonB
MRILASLALTVALCHGALAQPAPPSAPSAVQPPPEQPIEPSLAQPAPGVTIGPALPPPPSPEATTPANPLQPPPAIEASPPPNPTPAQPLPPATPPASPLQQQTARVSPEAAAYLQEIGVDPNAPDVIEVSQDAVGAYSLDSLAAGRDETQVRRFIYTRIFMHRFLADSDNMRIEPDKYDISFLTAEEVKLIADELNK